MKKSNFLAGLMIFSVLISFAQFAFGEEDTVKSQIMSFLGSDDPRDFDEGEKLFLQHPDILEEIIFSKEKVWGGFRNNALSALSFCCFHGTISSERFMDSIVRLIREIKTGSLHDISNLDRSLPGFLSRFGYVGTYHQLNLRDNSMAFFHCVEKLRKYGFISKQETSDHLIKAWKACDSFVANPKDLEKEGVDSFKNLSSIIERQKPFLEKEAYLILSEYSKNLLRQALDSLKQSDGKK